MQSSHDCGMTEARNRALRHDSIGLKEKKDNINGRSLGQEQALNVVFEPGAVFNTIIVDELQTFKDWQVVSQCNVALGRPVLEVPASMQNQTKPTVGGPSA